MPRGSKPGEHRGGRKRGTPNKLPKGERALVKLDAAEAEVRALLVQGLPLDTLGKDRLTELDAWAHSMAKQFAPKKDEKTGRMYWENDGDEARFFRFFRLCGHFAEARAPYESPRLSAIAAGHLPGDSEDDGSDPRENLMRIIENWIAADEAERLEKALDVTPPLESHTEAETVSTPPEPDDDCDGELA